MSLWRLWWLVILVPALIAGAVDYLRHRLLPGYLYRWPDTVNFAATVLLSLLVLAIIVSAYTERRKSRLLRAANDFASLWEMIRGSAGDMEPSTVAQRVLPQVVKWLGFDGGAVVLLENGRDLLMGTHGMSGEEAGALLTAFGGARREDSDYTWEREVAGFRYVTLVPLHSTGIRQGVLLLAGRRKPSPNAWEKDLLTLLGLQLGGLFENARLVLRHQHLAALEERDRLAREIHDSLAQELGYLNVKLEAVKGMESAGPLQVELNEMLEVVRSAYMDVREWVGGLRESPPEALGLTGFLERAVESFTRRTGIAASFEVRDGVQPSFSPWVEAQLIRVVQEALANIRKHAQASKASVVLDRGHEGVRVMVEDNGVGFLAAQAYEEGHYGLQTMRERLQAVGGDLRIWSYPGVGTRVEALLPTQGQEVTHAASEGAAGR